jgi:hypothetical protein
MRRRAARFLFHYVKLQPYYVEEATQFIETNIFASALNAIYLFAAQARSYGELLLRHSKPPPMRR